MNPEKEKDLLFTSASWRQDRIEKGKKPEKQHF